MKASHPHPGEGLAAVAAVAIGVLAVVAVKAAAGQDRPMAAGALAGAAALALALLVLSAYQHRVRLRVEHETLPAGPVDDSWFTPETLDGFPAEAVRPLLSGAGAPSPGEVYTAWVLVRHGHDAVWVAQHLGLPVELTRVLGEAAARQRR
ncbi:hypothetical protein [Streptomyces orinoci]|uniref:Secreted protein n=1 Tax=Streptomyces orinoci TaxID=67339 RepID=A0ABV3JPZ7_STRON|nr:hypothetical protein [Streptomyces orinoci]